MKSEPTAQVDARGTFENKISSGKIQQRSSFIF